MKNSFKIVIAYILLILLSVSSYALSTYDSYSVYNEIKAKVLYVKYENVPKIVYTNQRFSVDIISNILISEEDTPYTIHSFIEEDKKGLKLLTKDIIWTKIDKNNYKASIQFKVVNKQVDLPKITISLINNNTVQTIDTSILKSKKIIYRKIAIDQEKYSNVIASEFIINSIKTKQYTNKELIHIITITAINSNLEDFHLSKYKNQDIKALDSIENTQILYYSIITPRGQKSIDFNYFNTNTNKFENINIAIKLKEELVSTQTDLNPYENDMYIYKVIAISVVVLFFLMIYYFKREFFFLFFAILFATLLIYMTWPNKKIVLKKDTKVYILPTSNSTIFSILKENQEVKVLVKKEKFSKVLFKNEKIGWIKNGKN